MGPIHGRQNISDARFSSRTSLAPLSAPAEPTPPALRICTHDVPVLPQHFSGQFSLSIHRQFIGVRLNSFSHDARRRELCLILNKPTPTVPAKGLFLKNGPTNSWCGRYPTN